MKDGSKLKIDTANGDIDNTGHSSAEKIDSEAYRLAAFIGVDCDLVDGPPPISYFSS